MDKEKISYIVVQMSEPDLTGRFLKRALFYLGDSVAESEEERSKLSEKNVALELADYFQTFGESILYLKDVFKVLYEYDIYFRYENHGQSDFKIHLLACKGKDQELYQNIDKIFDDMMNPSKRNTLYHKLIFDYGKLSSLEERIKFLEEKERREIEEERNRL